ncbi:MAG: hypothetical protein WCI29_12495 [Actinomycetes bacterium]
MATTVMVNEEERTKIHASQFSLACGGLGLVFAGIGCFLSPGTPSGPGYLLGALGFMLIAVAIIAHVEHLSRRLGRPAVVFAIVSAVLLAVDNVPMALEPSRTADSGWIDYWNYVLAAAALCAAASVALAAMRKEARLVAHLAQGNSGAYAAEDFHTTVHASFFSLVTGALGFLLMAIGSLILIGGGGPAARLGWILQTISWVLIAVAIIAHLGHLSRSVGRLALVLAVIGLILNALATLPACIDPSGAGPIGPEVQWIAWGIADILGGISAALVAVSRRAQDAGRAVA